MKHTNKNKKTKTITNKIRKTNKKKGGSAYRSSAVNRSSAIVTSLNSTIPTFVFYINMKPSSLSIDNQYVQIIITNLTSNPIHLLSLKNKNKTNKHLASCTLLYLLQYLMFLKIINTSTLLNLTALSENGRQAGLEQKYRNNMGLMYIPTNSSRKLWGQVGNIIARLNKYNKLYNIFFKNLNEYA